MLLLLARVTIAEAPISEEAIIKQPNEAVQPPTQPNSKNVPKITIPRPRTQATLPKVPETYGGRHYSKEEVIQLIKDYARQYGVNEDLPLRIARCESGYNQFSKNSHSTASGVFQYIAGTWRNTEAGRQGISPFDADANVRMAIKSIASGDISNWNASKHCWNI